ncbi:hypothetical protein V498_06213 [Pseudogymnoascus sp. VKM F-4517 (FW-2822)]|nr:hypothetical protein V498_06213 [Pseudogymnoascus sp. VKM F-4517 (FW-2822)]
MPHPTSSPPEEENAELTLPSISNLLGIADNNFSQEQEQARQRSQKTPDNRKHSPQYAPSSTTTMPRHSVPLTPPMELHSGSKSRQSRLSSVFTTYYGPLSTSAAFHFAAVTTINNLGVNLERQSISSTELLRTPVYLSQPQHGLPTSYTMVPATSTMNSYDRALAGNPHSSNRACYEWPRLNAHSYRSRWRPQADRVLGELGAWALSSAPPSPPAPTESAAVVVAGSASASSAAPPAPLVAAAGVHTEVTEWAIREWRYVAVSSGGVDIGEIIIHLESELDVIAEEVITKLTLRPRRGAQNPSHLPPPAAPARSSLSNRRCNSANSAASAGNSTVPRPAALDESARIHPSLAAISWITGCPLALEKTLTKQEREEKAQDEELHELARRFTRQSRAWVRQEPFRVRRGIDPKSKLAKLPTESIHKVSA